MTLEKVITRYIETQPSSSKKKAVEKLLKEYIFENSRYTYEEIAKEKLVEFDLNGKYDSFLSNSFLDILISTKSDKVIMHNRLSGFIVFLNEYFAFKNNVKNIFDSIKPYEPLERQLNLLKLMQLDKALSLEEISRRFTLSKRNINEDIKTIEKGISFLGQRVKVDVSNEDGVKKYNSTVHPIFLPLNLREAVAMTVGLKKSAKDQGKPYSHTYSIIADWIYSQLSEYGQEKIQSALNISEFRNIHFNKHNNEYFSDDNNNERDINFELIMFEKSGKSGIVTIFKEKIIFNKLHLEMNYKENTFYIILKLSNGKIKRILKEDIIYLSNE